MSNREHGVQGVLERCELCLSWGVHLLRTRALFWESPGHLQWADHPAIGDSTVGVCLLGKEHNGTPGGPGGRRGDKNGHMGILHIHPPYLQAATTKVPEIRDVTRIERIGKCAGTGRGDCS